MTKRAKRLRDVADSLVAFPLLFSLTAPSRPLHPRVETRVSENSLLHKRGNIREHVSVFHALNRGPVSLLRTLWTLLVLSLLARSACCFRYAVPVAFRLVSALLSVHGACIEGHPRATAFLSLQVVKAAPCIFAPFHRLLFSYADHSTSDYVGRDSRPNQR